MPFNSIALPQMPTWPTKAKSPKTHSPRNTVDLLSVSDNFGVPSADDPDPYGVLALEKAGLEIKEAGTHSRPSSDNFEFHPSPTSPLFRHSFQSLDGVSKRASRRDSKRSMVSVDHGTQTADLPSPSEERDSIWSGHTRRDSRTSAMIEDKGIEAWSASVDHGVRPHDEADFAGIEGEQGREVASPRASLARPVRSLIPSSEKPILEETEPAESPSPIEAESEISSPISNVSPSTTEPAVKADNSEENFDEEEPIIAQVVQAAPAVTIMAQKVSSPKVARAKLVTIRGRPAPALPTRNPARARRVRAVNAQAEDFTEDESHGESSTASSPSPTHSGFDHTDERSNPWSEQTSLPDMEKSVPNSTRCSIDDRSKNGNEVSAEPSGETAESNTDSTLDAPTSREPIGSLLKEHAAGPKHNSVTNPIEEDSSTETVLPEPLPSSASVSNDTSEPSASLPSPLSRSDAPSTGDVVIPKATESSTTEPRIDTGVLHVVSRSKTPEPATGHEIDSHSPTSSLSGQENVENLIPKQSHLLVAEPEVDASDAASVSDYGDDEEKEKEQKTRDEDDETNKSDAFHSMPTAPLDAPTINPINVPEVPALPHAS